MLKNLFTRIFKRKEYKESIEIMNKLLGIEKPNFIIIFNTFWNKGNTRLSLTNYRNIWIKNRNRPQYRIYDNGPIYDGTCYELTIIFRYYIFTFINFNCKWHQKIWKIRHFWWKNKGRFNK